MSPVGAIFVPFPLKTGTNLLHPLPPSIVERVATGGGAHVNFLLKRRLHKRLRHVKVENGQTFLVRDRSYPFHGR